MQLCSDGQQMEVIKMTVMRIMMLKLPYLRLRLMLISLHNPAPTKSAGTPKLAAMVLLHTKFVDRAATGMTLPDLHAILYTSIFSAESDL